MGKTPCQIYRMLSCFPNAFLFLLHFKLVTVSPYISIVLISNESVMLVVLQLLHPHHHSDNVALLTSFHFLYGSVLLI